MKNKIILKFSKAKFFKQNILTLLYLIPMLFSIIIIEGSLAKLLISILILLLISPHILTTISYLSNSLNKTIIISNNSVEQINKTTKYSTIITFTKLTNIIKHVTDRSYYRLPWHSYYYIEIYDELNNCIIITSFMSNFEILNSIILKETTIKVNIKECWLPIIKWKFLKYFTTRHHK